MLAHVYTEPVPLKYGNSPQNIRRYTDIFYSVSRVRVLASAIGESLWHQNETESALLREIGMAFTRATL